MPIFRNSDRSLSALERKQRRIEEEERKYRAIMEEAADPRPVLPPPEELRPMRTFHAQTAAMPRQMARQMKRQYFASIMLFVVLSLATITAALWMLRLAQM